MSHAKQLVSRPRKYPFVNMRLADYKILDRIEGRQFCSRCNRSRKYFCYNCYVPIGNLGEVMPYVRLPIKIDIIKHKKEIDGKSTAVHAAILAPEDIKIYTYPNIPDYSRCLDETVLIFPSSDSRTIWQLFEGQTPNRNHLKNYPKGYNIGTLLKRRIIEDNRNDKNEELEFSLEQEQNQDQEAEMNADSLPIKRAVFIDSTWNQSRGLYKDPRIKALSTVVLQNRCSQFWRYQSGCPRWYLATIEAIHQFLLELHIHAWGLNPHYRGLENLEIEEDFCKRARFIDAEEDDLSAQAPYNGQYDNLMFLFANMYDLIHKHYDHKSLKSYNENNR